MIQSRVTALLITHVCFLSAHDTAGMMADHLQQDLDLPVRQQHLTVLTIPNY